MSTPLPEPEIKLHGKDSKGKLSAHSMELFTSDQMRAYGAAEYARAIEDAAAVAASLYTGLNGKGYTEAQIRKLGATP